MPTDNLCDVQHSSVRCVMGEARKFFERPPFGLRRRALFGLGLGLWLQLP